MIKFSKDFFAGAVLGFGAGVAVRSFRDDENSPVRAALKSAIHAAMTGFEKAKEGVVTLRETVEDVAAEVKAERDLEGGERGKRKAQSHAESVAVSAEAAAQPSGNT
jgi:hypothetical protein